MKAFFIGQIEMWANLSTSIPSGWKSCEGQLLPISQYQQLFGLIGTIYGGDGRTTFGLPDFRGRVPMSSGRGPGLTNRPLGGKGGSVFETLSIYEIPSHYHKNIENDDDDDGHVEVPLDFTFQLKANSGAGSTTNPEGNFLSQSTNNLYTTDSSEATELMGISKIDMELDVQFNFSSIGSDVIHYNVQPVLPILFIIATTGDFPSRT